MTSPQGSQGLVGRGIEDSLNLSFLGLVGRGMETSLGPPGPCCGFLGPSLPLIVDLGATDLRDQYYNP
jgi:hypothetical protein